ELSASLTQSLDEQRVAERALAAVVPAVADWGVLDVVDADTVRRLAQLHRAPERLALLAEWWRRWPPRPNPQRWIPRDTSTVVAHTRESILYPAVGAQPVEATWMEPEQRDVLQALGTHSAIAVPLTVGDQGLGAVVLVSGWRRFDQDDLRLAEDFAERTASAL